MSSKYRLLFETLLGFHSLFDRCHSDKPKKINFSLLSGCCLWTFGDKNWDEFTKPFFFFKNEGSEFSWHPRESLSPKKLRHVSSLLRICYQGRHATLLPHSRPQSSSLLRMTEGEKSSCCRQSRDKRQELWGRECSLQCAPGVLFAACKARFKRRIFVWLTRSVKPHYGITWFIYFFVCLRESSACHVV